MRGCVLLGVLGLGACFYEVPPLAVDAGGDALAADAAAEAQAQACTSAQSGCVATLAAGWAPIAFSPTRSAACPSNFTTVDLVGDPMAQSGVCTCSCMIATQPSCSVGMLSLMYGSTNVCANGPFNLVVQSEGQCVDYGGTINQSAFHKWSILPVSGGTCTSSALADTGKIATSSGRSCVPPPTCAEDVCNGMSPAGTQACITHDGDVACPSGPFAQKHVEGTAATAACSTCTACVVTAQCGPATIRDYGDAQCTVLKDTENLGGTCATTAMAMGVNHLTYTSQVQNAKCVAGASSPTVDLASKRTICCR